MISVAIPTLNGAGELDRTLSALTGVDELVVLDSHSTDGTRAVAERHGATVHLIEDFGHGRARNRLMELTRGDLVAFLTQDAEPAPGWLPALAAALEDPAVGLACGPYTPRADVHPSERRALTAWFAAMPAGLVTAVPDGPSPASFASSANLMLRRTAWERVPFRDVAYAEDQRLALDLLAAGWAKAWVPEAAVIHSHAYTPREQLRRWFDEFRALHDVYGWTAPAHPRTVLGTARAEAAKDRAAGIRPALARHLAREVTAAVATRADRLPAPLRRAFSLERRA